MLIKRSELHAMADAIRALDGRPKEIADKDGAKHVVVTPYAIPGKARMALARALRLIREDLDDFAAVRTGIFKKHAGEEKSIPATSAAAAAFHDELAEVMAEKIEVALPRIAEADLGIDSNQLPASALEALLPIIDA